MNPTARELARRHGHTVTALEGRLWLTVEGHLADIWLRPGDVVTLPKARASGCPATHPRRGSCSPRRRRRGRCARAVFIAASLPAAGPHKTARLRRLPADQRLIRPDSLPRPYVWTRTPA
jgi:hypothetical protein